MGQPVRRRIWLAIPRPPENQQSDRRLMFQLCVMGWPAQGRSSKPPKISIYIKTYMYTKSVDTRVERVEHLAYLPTYLPTYLLTLPTYVPSCPPSFLTFLPPFFFRTFLPNRLSQREEVYLPPLPPGLSRTMLLAIGPPRKVHLLMPLFASMCYYMLATFTTQTSPLPPRKLQNSFQTLYQN